MTEREEFHQFMEIEDTLSPIERLRGKVKFQAWLDWPDVDPADIEALLKLTRRCCGDRGDCLCR